MASKKNKISLLLLTLFISGTALAQNRREFRHYLYKGLRVEMFSYNNIKKSSQTKYSVNVETRDSILIVKTFMLRYVEKPDSNMNFDYILFFEHNKNRQYNKMLAKYKYREPIDTAALRQQVNFFIDHNFLFDTVVTFNNAKMKEKIMLASKNNISALCERNFTGFSKSIFPFALKEMDYAMRAARYQELFSMSDYKYLSGTATLLSDVVNFNGALQGVVTWEFDVMAGGKKEKNKMKLIATSLDEGIHWYFTEIMDHDVDNLQVGGFKYYDISLAPVLLPYFKKGVK